MHLALLCILILLILCTNLLVYWYVILVDVQEDGTPEEDAFRRDLTINR